MWNQNKIALGEEHSEETKKLLENKNTKVEIKNPVEIMEDKFGEIPKK